MGKPREEGANGTKGPKETMDTRIKELLSSWLVQDLSTIPITASQRDSGQARMTNIETR